MTKIRHPGQCTLSQPTSERSQAELGAQMPTTHRSTGCGTAGALSTAQVCPLRLECDLQPDTTPQREFLESTTQLKSNSGWWLNVVPASLFIQTAISVNWARLPMVRGILPKFPQSHRAIAAPTLDKTTSSLLSASKSTALHIETDRHPLTGQLVLPQLKLRQLKEPADLRRNVACAGTSHICTRYESSQRRDAHDNNIAIDNTYNVCSPYQSAGFCIVQVPSTERGDRSASGCDLCNAHKVANGDSTCRSIVNHHVRCHRETQEAAKHCARLPSYPPVSWLVCS